MKHLITLSFIFFVSYLIIAQEHPPVEVYTSKDYGADTQNWSISQSKEKYIYVANNKGLLEFNGALWKLYKSPNESTIRSVNVIDDYIYTGCYNEFGYWQRNDLGLLYYTSLSQELKIEFLEDEDFWNIIALNDYILFQSLKKIYIYNKVNKALTTIKSQGIIYKIFQVGGNIYFQQTKEGVFKIEKGKAVLVSNDEVLQYNRLVNIFSQNDHLLFETENSGFFIFKNDKLVRWDIEANELLSKMSVFRSIKLRDDSFILGTRSNGIIHLTSDGRLEYNISMEQGLSNNTVHGIFEDAESNIWLALENGINCINIKSPFRVYADDKGRIGTVYTSIVYNGNLYLGTNQGLFCKPFGSLEEFKLVEGIKEAVWCLTNINKTLFCGHDTGTSIVNNYQAEKINGVQQGTFMIKPIEENPDLILQGTYNGFYILQRLNDEWIYKNKIKGFDISSKFFEIYNGYIFVSHEYKGVYKLKISEDFDRVLQIEEYPSKGNQLNSSLLKYNNSLLHSYKEGVFAYDVENNAFVKDTVLSKLFKKEEYTSGVLVLNKESNILWGFSKNNLSYISPDRLSNIPKINRISYSESLSKGLSGDENVTYLNDQLYLIGTTNGFITLDLNNVKNKAYNISISNISKYMIGEKPEIVNRFEDGVFENEFNNISFSYHVPEFEKYLDTEYQYHLEGLYPNWSPWSTSGFTLMENLPHGNYIFKVRARVGNNISENIETFKFTIKRPWYLVNSMILFYAFLVLLFSLFMHTIYKRYYRKQREKLLEKTTRELELKELENRQQLMRFNNDKLRDDINSKNKELATSTMTLIKKNEFLNSIKKELLNIEGNKSIKNVVKIIDRNLSNNDDWNVFEEAFNNADKDFLKKIKSEHPALTSNDLRLCAYLRLNLSSKEIAPLLNISARSVEVKRYRLRKKMNLSHESSLTDYILEI